MNDLVHAALEVVAFLTIGWFLGATGGLFGIGGGLTAIPVLALFFGMDQQHAQGTALVMVAPNVLYGLYKYWRRGGIDLRVAAILAFTAVPVTYVGAHYATHAGSVLRVWFATFLAVLAVYFAYRALRDPRRGNDERPAPRYPVWTLGLVGAGGGFLSGMFSVGGAVFAVPILSLAYGYAQVVAQGYALALVAPGTLVGIAAYAAANDIVWSTGAALAVGGVLGVGPGVALAHRLPEKQLRLFFSILLAVSSIALYAKT